MKAVVDENISGLDHFADHLEILRLPGREITGEALKEAEVLLVRSVTRVDEALLAGSAVRFVGTATIGTDHLDTTWLEAADIAWASAPGCNADAAAQYTLGMLLLACERLGKDPLSQRTAIFGFGNVGRRVHTLLSTLGLDCVVRDPPLAVADALPSVSFEAALACDVVLLHTPLTHQGPWPTAGMIDADALARMPPSALLLNSARGAVVDEAALQTALARGAIHAALDVWPREPDISPALLDATTVASPHVAGYSMEGKDRGTRMILEAFLAWSGQGSILPLSEPTGDMPAERLDLTSSMGNAVTEAVIAATRVAQDDHRLRSAQLLNQSKFDALRREHAPRHEFSRIAVTAPNPSVGVLTDLGFGWVTGTD